MSATLESAPAAAASAPRPNWLEATGQRWKFRYAYALLNVGCLVWLLSWATRYTRFNGPPFGLTEIIGEVFAGLGLLALLLAIRCPQCRAWVALSHLARAPFTTWLQDFRDAEHCPRCARTSASDPATQAPGASRANAEDGQP